MHLFCIINFSSVDKSWMLMLGRWNADSFLGHSDGNEFLLPRSDGIVISVHKLRICCCYQLLGFLILIFK